MGMVLYDVAFTVLAVWFRRDYAKALLLVTAVAGLASTIFVPLTTLLVAMFGWRDALRGLALILALVTIPLHALVLRRPGEPGLESDPPDAPAADVSASDAAVPGIPASSERNFTPLEAVRAPAFWWLTGAFALDRIAVVAVAVHSVPLLLERGYPPALVAAAVGAIGLMQVAGRFLFAPATNLVPLRGLSAFTFGVRALSFTVLFLPGVGSLWLFAALFGAANGASTLARAALVAETYGSAHYGSINGGVATVVALVQTVVPLGVGLIHDALGSYDLVLWGLMITSLSAAVAVSRVRSQASLGVVG